MWTERQTVAPSRVGQCPGLGHEGVWLRLLTGKQVDDEKYSALDSPMSVIFAQQSRLSRMLDALTSLQSRMASCQQQVGNRPKFCQNTLHTQPARSKTSRACDGAVRVRTHSQVHVKLH